jgi:hypothetical protein
MAFDKHRMLPLALVLALVAVLPAAGAEVETSPYVAMYRQFSEESDARAERVARRALKNYLLEETSLREAVRALKGEPRKEESRQQAYDYGISLSGGAARLELRRNLGGAGLELGFDTRGRVNLMIDHSRLAGLRLAVGYDSRHRSAKFACRFYF